MTEKDRNLAVRDVRDLPRRLRPILSLEDLEPAAQRILPHAIFSFISGGSESGASLLQNRVAFQEFELHPRVLVDTSARTTETTLFGETWSAPFGIAPMGGAGLAGFRADLALVSAAAAENIPFILSSSSLVPMEEVARVNPKAWFQAYLDMDRGVIAAHLDRVAASGFRTLVITADVPVAANRENLVRVGFSSPLRPSLRLAFDGAMHPRWLFGTALRTLMTDGMPHYENSGPVRGMAVFSRGASRPHVRDALSWSDLEWIRGRWAGRLILKGVLSAADAAAAQHTGVDGVIVSNHGGRQLDGAVAPLRVLPRITGAASGMAVLYDSGIRRGTDVVKAMALGADFVFAGRPFLYAAALLEAAGVRHAIGLLRSEIRRNLALLGCRTLADSAGCVFPRQEASAMKPPGARSSAG